MPLDAVEEAFDPSRLLGSRRFDTRSAFDDPPPTIGLVEDAPATQLFAGYVVKPGSGLRQIGLVPRRTTHRLPLSHTT